MIKKKLVSKTAVPTGKPTKKLVPRKQVEVEDEPEDTDEEDIDLEENDEGEEEEPTPKPAKKAILKGKPSKKNAIADAFNEAPAAGMEIAEGEHEAILYKMEGGQTNDGRPFIRSRYAVCEEMEGDNTIAGIYMMRDSEGKPAWTVKSFEQMCDKIGMGLVRPITGEDLQAVYEFVEENKPGCIINVSYVNGRALANFVDICDNETVDNWRESVQF